MTLRFTVPSAIVATFAALSSARAEEVEEELEEEVEEVPAPTEEVIEVSGRAPTPTQPIEALDRAAIQRMNATTAGDVLGRVAGIQTDGPHNARDRAAHVRIRGLDPRYTLALVDGERVPARDVRGVVDFSTLPTAAIQRISRMVPDPIGQPTVEVKAAALWSHRLADDVVVEPEPPTGCGCSTRSGAPAGGILVGVAVLFSMFRRGDKKKKPGKTSLLAWSRKIHTWTGVALALFIFVEGCTGLFLTHKDDLKGFAHTELPFGGGARAAELTRAALELEDPAHLVVATRDRVAHSRDAGASWSPVGATSGFDKIEALSVAAGAIWVGHGEGLARCALDGVACAAIDLGVTGRAEVRAIAMHDGKLFVAIHRHGVRVSDDGGTSWSDATASLWSDPRSLDEKGERHVHGIAFEGASLWVATSAGLFRASDGGWARAGLPERYVEDVAPTGRAVWATTKHPPALLVSSDRGISWRSIEALPDGKLVAAGERVLVPAKRGLFEVTATGAPSRVSIPGLDDNGPVGLGAAGDRLIAVRGARAAVATSGTWQATTAVAIEGRGKAMTVGKFLEDLHTGELFGKQLWIVYDLGALAMILFVFTGLHMWIAPVLVRRRKRAKHAPKAGALDVAEPT